MGWPMMPRTDEADLHARLPRGLTAQAARAIGREPAEPGRTSGRLVLAADGGEIISIKIKPEAIDPDDAEGLEDLVLAGVNEALETRKSSCSRSSAAPWAELGGLGLPGL